MKGKREHTEAREEECGWTDEKNNKKQREIR